MPRKGQRNIELPRGFGERLRALRNAVGFSRQELADKAGISFNSVNNYEQNRSERANEKILQDVARTLGVSFEELVYGKRRWRLTPPVAIVGAAVIGLLVTGWLHANWVASAGDYRFERVLNYPIEEGQAVDFVDLDDDGHVDHASYSNKSRFILSGVFNRKPGHQWRPNPLFQRTHDDREQLISFYHDVNKDGWKDLFVERRWGDSTRVIVRDVRTGDSLYASPIVSGRPSPGRDHWDGTQETVWAWEDPERGAPLALIRVNCDYSRGRPREIRCVDLSTGEILWSRSEGAYLGRVTMRDLDGDGEVECLVDCPSTNNGGDNGHTDDARTWLLAFELDGREMWHHQVEGKWAHVATAVLTSGADAALGADTALVFAAVENRDPDDPVPSRLLLLNGATGADVDSISYTDRITNSPVSYVADDGTWNVFCGTSTGLLQKYRVAGNAISRVAERQISSENVWVVGPLAGDTEEPVLIVGVTGDRFYLANHDLELVGEWRDRLERRVSPGVSFSDPDGNSYVPVRCGKEPVSIAVERVSKQSGDNRTPLYSLAYLVLLAPIAYVSSRRRRKSTA